MLAEERRLLITEWTLEAGRLDATQAATKLQVATETVRRDRDILQRRGVVRRVHGGAIAISPAVDVQLQYNQARIVEKTLAFRTTHPGRFSDLQIRSYGHATSLRTRNSDKDTQLRSSSSHGAAHHTTANARSLNQRRMLSI